MSAKLLRISNCLRHISKLHNATTINRTLVTLSGPLRADAAAAASVSQRKIELKEPIGVDKLQHLFDNEVKNGDIVPVFKRALLYGNKIAVKDNTGEYSYRQILDAARKLSTELSAHSYGKWNSIDNIHKVISMLIQISHHFVINFLFVGFLDRICK